MDVSELYTELFGNRPIDDRRLNADSVRLRFCLLGRFFPDEVRRALPLFEDELGSEDPAVRIPAAECLGLLGRCVDESLEVLSDALHCFEGDHRLRAVQALGLLGRTAAPVAPQLIELVRSPDEPLLPELLHALRLIHPPANEIVGPLLDLLAALRASQTELHHLVRDLLVAYSRAAVPFVLDRIAGPSAGAMAWEHVGILERIGWLPQEAAPTLLRSLRDRKAWRRSFVVRLFAPSDGVEAFFWFDDRSEAIRLGLADDDPEVRRLAAEAQSLSNSPTEESPPEDREEEAATRAAATAPAPEDVTQILAAVADRGMDDLYDLKLRQIFNGMSFRGLRQSWPFDLFHLLRAAAASDRDAAIAAMRRALDSECDGAAINACRLLWELRHDAAEVLPTLDRILRTLAPRTEHNMDRLPEAAACAELLAAIGPPTAAAVPALRQLLADYYWLYKRYAAETLGRIGPAAAAAIADLVETIAYEDDTNDGLRSAAVEARRTAVAAACRILDVGPGVEAAFLEAEANPYVRARICDALRDLDRATMRAILEAIQDRYGGSVS